MLLAIAHGEATARAVASHTGALASDAAAIDAACAAAGIERVRTPAELIDAADGLLRAGPLGGRRIAVLSDGGGHGGIAASLVEEAGLEAPRLSDALAAELRAFLPPTAAVGNPIDLAGGGEQDVRSLRPHGGGAAALGRGRRGAADRLLRRLRDLRRAARERRARRGRRARGRGARDRPPGDRAGDAPALGRLRAAPQRRRAGAGDDRARGRDLRASGRPRRARAARRAGAARAGAAGRRRRLHRRAGAARRGGDRLRRRAHGRRPRRGRRRRGRARLSRRAQGAGHAAQVRCGRRRRRTGGRRRARGGRRRHGAAARARPRSASSGWRRSPTASSC